ncbi:MAG TPA: hypothetical protein VFZ59_23560, partial [Verrucomicrobiae bacterium]|nr:hypothetical protein [Verrucomicrobiae bacterium]
MKRTKERWRFLAATLFVAVALQLEAQVPVYTASAPPPTPALTDLPLVSSVSKDGITWMFQSPARVGQFINGDYYVVGPVTITNITPPATNGRNGSMKNLRPNPQGSGFDSRIDAGRYNANLRVNPPLTLQPGDMLASSISVETIGVIKRVMRTSDNTISPVRTVSLLTCVTNPLPPDAFRPGYCGSTRTIYYSRNLHREFLARLAPVSGTPALAQFEGYFRRPWIDTVEFGFDAPIEYMPDYGREVGRAVGHAALLLNLNFTAQQKEALLVYFTQYGIDLYSAVRSGHNGWRAYGGWGSGRKLPILFAGVLLQNTAMQTPPGEFGEDQQTIIATGAPYGPGWNGATALYAGHRGTNGESISPGWGPYEHLQPSNWVNQIGESYRRCCTSVAWVGQVVAARIMGITNVWNHPPLFAYVDRWMTEDDAEELAAIQQQTGATYPGLRQRDAWDPFVNNMWATYRTYVPRPIV